MHGYTRFLVINELIPFCGECNVAGGIGEKYKGKRIGMLRT